MLPEDRFIALLLRVVLAEFVLLIFGVLTLVDADGTTVRGFVGDGATGATLPPP